MHFESLSVREWPDPRTTRPHVLPIYATSSFDFDDIEQGIRIFANEEQGHTYSRYGNPTVEATAAKIAALESFDSDINAIGLMTNSGMAAIEVLTGGLLKQGDKILTQPNLYGGTTELLQKILSNRGIEIIYGDLSDGDKMASLLHKKLIHTPDISGNSIEPHPILCRHRTGSFHRQKTQHMVGH